MAVNVRKRVKNESYIANCKPSDSVGDCVFVLSDKVGDKYQVTVVDIDSPTHRPGIAIGVISDKVAPNECVVHLFSKLANVYTGLTPGALLYVGLDGRPTETRPSQPVSGVRTMQVIGYALSSFEVFINPGDPERLGPLSSTVTLNDFKRNIPLYGIRNGVNLVFSTLPDKFIREPFVEVLHRNGVTQEEGPSSDYHVSESGGVGTGFDTILLLDSVNPPLSWEKLSIDYIKGV